MINRKSRRLLSQFIDRQRGVSQRQLDDRLVGVQILLDAVGGAWHRAGAIYVEKERTHPGNKPAGGEFHAPGPAGTPERGHLDLEVTATSGLQARPIKADKTSGKVNPAGEPPIFWDRVSAQWEAVDDDESMGADDALLRWILASFEA